jgi:flagellar basal body-associated protein FliL
MAESNDDKDDQNKTESSSTVWWTIGIVAVVIVVCIVIFVAFMMNATTEPTQEAFGGNFRPQKSRLTQEELDYFSNQMKQNQLTMNDPLRIAPLINLKRKQIKNSYLK